LDIRGVSVRFGGLAAVSDLALALGQGEIHALIGPNGAGKSTVINCISGFQPLTSGEMRLGDERLARLTPVVAARKGIARTFQTPQLFGRLSVADNVRVASRTGRTGLFSEAELLELVGLAGLQARTAEGLAYGQQRLLEVARALACAPRLLLLDEPAAGLAADDVARLAQLLRRIAGELGLGILLVEHNVGLVKRLCDRATVMHHGLVIASGSPAAVLSDPAVVTAYLGTQAPLSQARPC
jgi:ABC-type branched-subunit amino acid transport system ATPase component